jgi:hypothetical protein
MEGHILILLHSTVPFCLFLFLCLCSFLLFFRVMSLTPTTLSTTLNLTLTPKLRYETRNQKALLHKKPWKCVSRRSVLILFWCGLVVSCRVIIVRLSWVLVVFGPCMVLSIVRQKESFFASFCRPCYCLIFLESIVELVGS